MPDMLTDLTVEEGSLVDRGANQTALVMLFKRRDGPAGDKPPLNKQNRGGAVNDNWLRRVVMGIAKKLGLSDEDLSKMAPMMPNEMMEHEKAMTEFWNLKYALSRSIDSIMESSEVEMDKKIEMVGQAVAQFQEACKALMPHVQMEQDMYKVESFLEDLDASGSEVAKVQTVVKALVPPNNTPPVNNPAVNKKEGDVPMTLDEFLKSLSPEKRADAEAEIAKRVQPTKFELPSEIAKQLDTATKAATDAAAKVEVLEKQAEAAERRADAAETMAKAEQEARVSREYLEKAAKYPSAGTPAEVADILRKAFSLSEEYGKKLEETLGKTEAVMAQSKLFQEVGKAGRPAAGSAIERLEKRALEAFPGKNVHAAVDEFLKTAEGSALYSESLKEAN